MKIKELLEQIDALSDDDRENWIRKLVNWFTPESLGTLINFQKEWVDSDESKGIQRSYEEFKTAQNNLIRKCAEIEESKIGSHVRVNRGLPRWDNEVDLDESPLTDEF